MARWVTDLAADLRGRSNGPVARTGPVCPPVILYRILISLAAPVIILRLIWRRLRGAGSAGSLRERLGSGARRTTHKVIWVHGASNGELASARRLIETALARDPELSIVVTCNTETGKALAESWRLARLSARLAPLDLRLVLWRFLHGWKPRALIVLESELWPNRFAACGRRDIPVILIAARMSESAAKRWRRMDRITRPMLGHVNWLSAQDDASAERFRDLGLPADRIGPVVNLKSTAAQTGPSPEQVASLPAPGPRASTFLAASTHEGEDEPVIAAFVAAHRQNPALRMILAPRHPARAPRIRKLLDETGLPYAVRSEGAEPGPDEVIYLADTMGEMPLWYHLSGVTFVGGSLVEKGGHTPFEPAAAGSAILHGPHVANFRAAYAALDLAGGARVVPDARTLAETLAELAHPEAQARMAAAASAALAETAGPDGVDALLSRIAKLTGIASLEA